MGVVWRSIGVEFYFQDEINAMIGDSLARINEVVGQVWRSVMEYEIPFVNWTPFDILLSVALEGPVGTLMEMIVGAVITNVVAPVVDGLVSMAVIRLLSS